MPSAKWWFASRPCCETSFPARMPQLKFHWSWSRWCHGCGTSWASQQTWLGRPSCIAEQHVPYRAILGEPHHNVTINDGYDWFLLVWGNMREPIFGEFLGYILVESVCLEFIVLGTSWRFPNNPDFSFFEWRVMAELNGKFPALSQKILPVVDSDNWYCSKWFSACT